MSSARKPGTVLITGGTGGIGSALVETFRGFGDEVWFTDPGTPPATTGTGPGLRAFQLDLTSYASVQQFVADLPGTPDILIHNAALGSATVKRLTEAAHEQDRLMFQVNAVGILWLNRLLVPRMVARNSGKIVLFSSVGGGITIFPGFSYADAMSKAAVATLGRALAADLAPTGVDVFTVCPGATRTPMFEASTLAALSPQQRRDLIGSLPGGRLVEPAEIADLVAYMCTDAGKILRGAVIDASLGLGVNPGMLAEGSRAGAAGMAR
ncbi:SDR family NAD(P)-dependent oxidoreductase [Labrys monachus]|uniref:NAD(P)-dependent dehydrogenase (Short-subunit alcohol dehydrogenase family) n=1 Tax=Labrys monachus TaxID=217067 RepID=A0ABU0FB00_9HYPH|nr:SDR family oxidoreductase [Labrys monachus]MDQ0391792.1 NAD(P)-dependent dehydrogenase (short-subunit alcohol dehydrogenase family) [Labrys monachus]